MILFLFSFGFLNIFLPSSFSWNSKVPAVLNADLSVYYCLFHPGVIPDAYLVPVSVSYEKILDGNFNNEQMVCYFWCDPAEFLCCVATLDCNSIMHCKRWNFEPIAHQEASWIFTATKICHARSLNTCVCQNGGIVWTFTHGKIYMFTVVHVTGYRCSGSCLYLGRLSYVGFPCTKE